jgi:hypothetical protein
MRAKMAVHPGSAMPCQLAAASISAFHIIDEGRRMDYLSTCTHGHWIVLFRSFNAFRQGGGGHMKLPRFSGEPLATMIAVTLLSACGGGGSSGAPGNASEATQPANTSTAMTMSCVDGPAYQCSGSNIIRIDNGVALSSSGVQAYGKSTSDLANPIVEKTTAYGLALASGGVAEVRLAKDGNGVMTKPALLLSNLGISWDGKNERPAIIEVFQPTQGRSRLNSNGSLAADLPLADSSDLGFYDFANKGTAATQANYANNRYFPRSGNPSRCLAEVSRDKCPTEETKGISYQAGDWSRGGGIPDYANAGRLHGDGDVHAGDGKPDAAGRHTVLPGGSGKGVPFPGSKGYRSFDNWSYKYGNLGAWITQDTVRIVEWTPGSDEHSMIRRGIVAFGDVSKHTDVPQTGSATYSGTAYGWHAGNGTEDPAFFRAAASATVDFATREAIVTVQNPTRYDGSGTQVPVSFKAITKMGAAGESVANYLTGPVDNGNLKGGLGGRYFGPLLEAGASGKGPAELGGAFTLSASATGAAVVGGFIARKQ